MIEPAFDTQLGCQWVNSILLLTGSEMIRLRGMNSNQSSELVCTLQCIWCPCGLPVGEVANSIQVAIAVRSM